MCFRTTSKTHTHTQICVWFNSLSLQFQLAFPAYTRYTRRPKHNTVHHVDVCTEKAPKSSGSVRVWVTRGLCFSFFPGGKPTIFPFLIELHKNYSMDFIETWCNAEMAQSEELLSGGFWYSAGFAPELCTLLDTKPLKMPDWTHDICERCDKIRTWMQLPHRKSWVKPI